MLAPSAEGDEPHIGVIHAITLVILYPFNSRPSVSFESLHDDRQLTSCDDGPTSLVSNVCLIPDTDLIFRIQDRNLMDLRPYVQNVLML